MYNDIFTIGSFTVHGYGLMIAIGVVAALIIGDKRAASKGLDGDFIYPLTAWTVILGFIAAKVLFIITNFREFLADPKGFITGSGFVVFGGIIGGILTIFGYSRIKKKDPVAYLDLMVPCVAIAQGFGRIGCLLAGCCYGRETDSPLGIIFRHSHYAPNDVKLIPTQIIMSVGNFIIATILLIYARKERSKGKVGCLYIMLYSFGRFFVEFLRNDYRGNVGIFSTSQFIGMIMFALSTLVFFLLPFKKKEA
ncbi:MAG: prolipoprotein diacylglyceryl transferase [Lachnospiraceae bacterium]|nr:prolipoprotein diacylglyceryl transferase [Lachnospiraceae bacterium]